MNETKLSKEEFISGFYEVLNRAISFSEKARREGLLALEEEIDVEKANKRDIFEYGLRFVVDGHDQQIIDKILSNIVNQEKDEYTKLLKTIQKEAVLSIQSGDNTRILLHVMLSHTDLTFEDPVIGNLLND